MSGPPIVLGSGSAIRAAILRAAGFDFEIEKPRVDEAVVKEAGRARREGAAAIALALAERKALDVSSRRDGLVIGADQILATATEFFDKPASMAEARERLLMLAGRDHRLVGGAALARAGEILWRHNSETVVSFRALTSEEVDAYLGAVGEKILASVGAYEIEGLGARLIDRLEGDYFAALGLPLFPLLAALRRETDLGF